MFRHFKSWLVGEEERMRRRGGLGIGGLSIFVSFILKFTYLFNHGDIILNLHGAKSPWFNIKHGIF